jgi:hypothetical protein
MSIKTKLVTAATTLTVMAGVGMAGTLTANAATVKCGASCTDFYSRAAGSGFVLHTSGQSGQPVTVAGASRASQGEDFTIDALGPLSALNHAGIVPGGVDARYGGMSAYEIEYTPGASPSIQCLGTAALPAGGTQVTLQPCGRAAKTIWLLSPQETNAGFFYVLISAATLSSSGHAWALTEVSTGAPLTTTQLLASTASGFAHQEWGTEPGVLPSSS